MNESVAFWNKIFKQETPVLKQIYILISFILAVGFFIIILFQWNHNIEEKYSYKMNYHLITLNYTLTILDEIDKLKNLLHEMDLLRKDRKENSEVKKIRNNNYIGKSIKVIKNNLNYIRLLNNKKYTFELHGQSVDRAIRQIQLIENIYNLSGQNIDSKTDDLLDRISSFYFSIKQIHELNSFEYSNLRNNEDKKYNRNLYIFVSLIVVLILACAVAMALIIKEIRDLLSKQNKITKALVDSENNLLEAQRIAHLGSWELDLFTSKLYWSEEIFNLFELDPAMFGASYEEFLVTVHPDDREELNRVFQESVDNKTPYNYTHRLVMKDGRIKYVNEKGRTYYDENGIPVRSVGTVLDITERKLAEDKVKNLNEELEQRVRQRTLELHNVNLNLEHSIEVLKNTQAQLVQSEKMASLGGMVAGVAHEINTPIGMCVSTASYLLEKVTEYARLYEDGVLTRDVFEEYLETSKESARILLNNLKRAADLISSFKQVAVDQASDHKRIVNLKEYLREVLQSLKHEYARAGHRVTLECPDHIRLNTYPGAFSQIITNLVVNSLAHGFEDMEKGEIGISVKASGDNIELVYRDNGKGLEEDVLNNIFEPFFTTKRGRGGSGLGMHIVFNIVHQALNGRISCNSRPGEGVKFTIEIPQQFEELDSLNRSAG